MLERGLIRVCNFSADWEYVVKSRLIFDVSSVRIRVKRWRWVRICAGSGRDGYDGPLWATRGISHEGGVLRVEGGDVRRLEDWIGVYWYFCGYGRGRRGGFCFELELTSGRFFKVAVCMWCIALKY